MNLDDYRADIDRIDRELVEKLEEMSTRQSSTS